MTIKAQATVAAALLAAGGVIGTTVAPRPTARVRTVVQSAAPGPEGGPPQVSSAAGEPIAGVLISATAPGQRARFDFSCDFGHWHVPGLVAGRWRFVPTRPGYFFVPPSAAIELSESATPNGVTGVQFTGYPLQAPTAPAPTVLTRR